MKYTVRYAHLAERSKLSVGDKINNGDKIGICGNTGASDGRHLHIDCVEGIVSIPWRLSDTERGLPKSCPRQLNYFIDNFLFMSYIEITTPYCDPDYMVHYGKLHHGYDVVPKDRKSYGIHWNRSKEGEIVAIGEDDGYGNFIHVAFEA